MGPAEASRATWRKSAWSDNGASNCIEVAELGAGHGVRDSKGRGHGPVLLFSMAGWAAFLDGVKRGQFG